MAVTKQLAIFVATIALACSMEQWKHQLLDGENHYRGIHGADPLTYNEELASAAQAHAEKLAQTCDLSKNPHASQSDPGLFYQGQPTGENINKGKSNVDNFQQWAEERAANTAGAYYDEEKKYPYGDFDGLHGSDHGAGHFTQMVWKGSQEVGYGFATCNGDTFFVVGRYFPLGKTPSYTENTYKVNVLPPQH